MTPVEAGVMITIGSVVLVGAVVWATTAAAGVAAEVVTATVTDGTVCQDRVRLSSLTIAPYT